MLVFGWARTYGVRYNIVRMTNNYGPNQFPEKLIPKSAIRMRRGLPAIIHGDGSYYRSWLHVEDSVDAILTIMAEGENNAIYNVHGETELQNIEVVRRIASILGIPENKAYILVANRVGQDVRYSLDDSKLRSIGWKPTRDFDSELRKIVLNDDFKRFL
jgi:dTDP-glucose 4,6-dehydratase